MSRRVWRAPRVVGRRIEGQLVVVSLPRLETRVLNDVGARVWELADGRTIDEIASVLVVELGAGREAVHADVLAFVEALAVEGVLRVGERG